MVCRKAILFKQQIDSLEIVGFGKGGWVVEGVSGGLKFLVDTSGGFSGLSNNSKEFIGTDMGGAGGGVENATGFQKLHATPGKSSISIDGFRTLNLTLCEGRRIEDDKVKMLGGIF